MVLRLLVGLLFLASCGKQVNIDHTALKEASALTDRSKSYQIGVINKVNSGNTYLVFNQNSYSISTTSSYNAKSFIEKLPMGQTNVTFEGKVNKGEVVLTKISYR